MRRCELLLAAALTCPGLLLQQGCPSNGDDQSAFEDRQPCTFEVDCPDGWTCFDEECAKVCNVSADCPAGDQACENGVCTPVSSPDCRAAADCPAPGECHDDDVPTTCVGGKCRYELRPVGSPCNDGDRCTDNDRCAADARCAGVAKVCDSPPEDECTDGDATLVTYPKTGACEPSTGDCKYAPLASPCADCAATCLDLCAGVTCEETHGGCQGSVCSDGACDGSGVCVPTDPPTCSYERAADGTACEPADGPAGSLAGQCLDGWCGECASSADCTDPPTAYPACYDAACNSGTCSYTVRPTEVCAPQACADNWQSSPRVCTWAGDCPDAGGVSCDGYACSDDTCSTGPCSTDVDCATGFYCSASSCVACEVSESICDDQIDNDCDSDTDCLDADCGGACHGKAGDSCTVTSQCELGLTCVDYVCCRTSGCGPCQSCAASDDGTCAGVTADDGRLCQGDCDHCVSGTCTPRAAGATEECGTCQACDAAGGQCAGVTADEGNNCNDDCSRCVSGSCEAQPAGYYAECSGGDCLACTTAGGDCGAYTGAAGTSCDNADSYCCAGTCVNPTGDPSEYGASCGAGNCSGTWGCDGTSGLCSSYGDPCDYCAFDTAYDAACTGDDGTRCAGTGTGCPICNDCQVISGVAQCVPYPAGVADTESPYTCMVLDACNGYGSCALANGQSCLANSECASANCIEGHCCDSACTGVCYSCDGSENTGGDGVCSYVEPYGRDNYPTELCDYATGCNADDCACNGAGACLGTNYSVGCTDDSDCMSNNCNTTTDPNTCEP